MPARDFLNNNSAVVTILALVVLVGALGAIIWNSGGGGGQEFMQRYYYDLNTGKLFVDSKSKIAPIDAPSGPYNGKQGGVSAVVFGCGECQSSYDGMTQEEVEEAGAIIGWLEMLTAEAKKEMEQTKSGQRAPGGPGGQSVRDLRPMTFMEGRLVKYPSEEDWYDAGSQDAMTLRSEAQTRCASGRLKVCSPK
jgi:hypothetical protein